MISNETNPQFYNLSAAQMLELVKRQNLITPLLRDCAVERDDGIELDDYLSTKIEQWYYGLLLTADVSLLPVEDVKNDTTLTTSDDGIVTVSLPDRTVRPVEVKLPSWQRSVTQFLSPDDCACRFQYNIYTRGRSVNPAAIFHGNRLSLFSASSGDNALSMLRAVVRPASGNYVFHRSIPLPVITLE